ncbi:MAG: ComEC/Rec2 family competence protein [Patescibacteria group bacterium]
MEISYSRIFLWFLVSFILSAAFELLAGLPIWVSYFFLMGAIACLPFIFKSSKAVFLFFILLGIFLGFWRTSGQLEEIYPRSEEKYEGLVYVSSLPEEKSDYQKVVFCPAEEETNKGEVFVSPDCREKFIYYASGEEVWDFGQVKRVFCQLENPENKYPKFNYIKYLAMDDIYQVCQDLSVRKDQEEFHITGFYKYKTILFENIFKVRKILENKIREVFSFPESAYLAGLLLGGEDRLPEDVKEDFRETGTTHTVAVSGFNITVLAGFFVWLGVMIGLWRQKAFWLAVFGIAFFVLMIGSPESAVRAAIMGILILWASKRGRLANSIRAIILAAAIMIWVSPLIIFYDAGFQLSFLAAASIVLVYEPLSKKFNVQNDFLELKSILLVTFSAQIGVLGILIYSFETFSPISFLANLIILPAIPVIMLGGFASVFMSFLFPFLGNALALPVDLALALEIKAVNHLAEISWSEIEIGDVGIYWLMGYYAFFALFVFWLKREEAEKVKKEGGEN